MTRRIQINGSTTHTSGAGPVSNAEVRLIRIEDEKEDQVAVTRSNAAGRFSFAQECEDGHYVVRCRAFGRHSEHGPIDLDEPIHEITLDLDLGFRLTIYSHSSQDERLVPTSYAVVGRRALMRVETSVDSEIAEYEWKEHRDVEITRLGREAELVFARAGRPVIEATIVEKHDQKARASSLAEIAVSESDVQKIGGHIRVTMDRTPSDPTLDQALWVAIRNRTHAISFERYREFLARVFEDGEPGELADNARRLLRGYSNKGHGIGTYQVLKYLTEAFLLLECGVRIERHRHYHPFDPDEEARRLGRSYSFEEIEQKLHEYLGQPPQLPYITRVLRAAYPYLERGVGGDDRLLSGRVNEPLLIELIHTYFLEEGMLMQTMDAICQRFKNYRGLEDRDPLVNLEIDPLRPLNNLIWGYIQDEPNRLTVKRRAFEYLHEYNLTLSGWPLGNNRSRNIRSTFLEAFHNLLYQSTIFFQQDFQTTVIADGFPLLNVLKEVHLALAQNDGNQLGDLPWTTRVDTLLIQFILARPEMRTFLQSRVMVPYKEAWMPQVDAMKAMQGWTDVTVTHFRDLAVYGEQLLLSVRYGDWISVNDEDSAKNWARFWRQEILGYLHAYRAATGVDLTNPNAIDATIPAVHLQRRLAMQRGRPEAPSMLGFTPMDGQLTPRMGNRVRRSP
jgi:hypothetical protein